jgi:hypothetical protein
LNIAEDTTEKERAAHVAADASYTTMGQGICGQSGNDLLCIGTQNRLANG